MSGINNVIPEEKVIKIKDRSYVVGKLGLTQIVRLTRFFAQTIKDNTKKILESESQLEGGSNIDNLLLLFEILNEEEVSQLVSILLSEKDTDFIKQNCDIEAFSELILILSEQNDLKKIWGNLKRAGAKIIEQMRSSVPSAK